MSDDNVKKIYSCGIASDDWYKFELELTDTEKKFLDDIFSKINDSIKNESDGYAKIEFC